MNVDEQERELYEKYDALLDIFTTERMATLAINERTNAMLSIHMAQNGIIAYELKRIRLAMEDK